MAEAAAQTLSLVLEEQKKQLARLQEAIDDRQTITGAQAKAIIREMGTLSIQAGEKLLELFNKTFLSYFSSFVLSCAISRIDEIRKKVQK